MKKVTAFQVGDQVFTDEGAAIHHERLTEIRDLITKSLNINVGTPLQPVQFASFAITHGDALNAINQSFKRKLAGYNIRTGNNKIKVVS